MKISNEQYLYDPTTGEVIYQNPVPTRALRVIQETGKSGAKGPAAAAEQSGIGVINYQRVIRYSTKQIEDFLRAFEIKDILAQNEKIKKPRKKTDRPATILGVSFGPHYYANMLAVLRSESGELAQFDKQTFNAFNGTKEEDARRYIADMGADIPRRDMLNFCMGASDWCRTACLVYTGVNPAADEAARSKMKLMNAMLSDPELFTAALRAELQKKAKGQRSRGKDLVVRLNMLSDLPWYVMCPDLLLELRASKEVYWYDYTKVPFWHSNDYNALNREAISMGIFTEADYAAGERVLDLTFSYSGDNEGRSKQALDAGYRVAAVFSPADTTRSAGIKTRTSWGEITQAINPDGTPFGRFDDAGNFYLDLFGEDRLTVDGDGSDYRIDDPMPCIVALNFKQASLIDAGEMDAALEAARSGQKLTQRQKDLVSRHRHGRIAPVPGIAERMSKSREKFTRHVPDAHGGGAARAKVLAMRTLEPLWDKGVDITADEAFTILEMREQDRKDPRKVQQLLSEIRTTPMNPIPMRRIAGTDIGIGPHVPTLLND